ncbi:MAG: hypothetical protein HY661_09575 [Betaproteobacteria bacterium]|nr:hypothetical protein [Betaproteobacteria bacterium]
MNEPRRISPRARLQELLAIPDRDRTEAEWDELNELEIMLASQNREKNPQQDVRRNLAAPAAAGHRKPLGRPQGKKQVKKFHRRPPRGNVP